MKNSNQKWLMGIAAVIAVLVVSVVLFAQEHPNKNNSMNRIYDSSWWNSNVPEKYWLNDDQVSQVNKIKAEYDELIQPEMEKLNSVRVNFSDYKQQDDISSKRIREYQNQIREIKDNIYSLKMEASSKIRKTFNEGQRAYFNDSQVSWWDGFYDRCGWDDGDMDYGYGMRNRGSMHNSSRCCW